MSITRLICRLFGHIPVLSSIKSGDTTYTSRGIVIGPTKYTYDCACCGAVIDNPFGESPCSNPEPSA